jgi:hypothetical protein
VRIRNKSVTTPEIDIEGTEIEACDISILKTVPIHRAAEIQHDIEAYLRMNRGKFTDIASNNLSSLPVVEEIATPIYIITVFGRRRGELSMLGKPHRLQIGVTTRFVRNRTVSHFGAPGGPFTYGRLRKALPQTADPGDSPFKNLFQNRLERQTVSENHGRGRSKDGPTGMRRPGNRPFSSLCSPSHP